MPHELSNPGAARADDSAGLAAIYPDCRDIASRFSWRAKPKGFDWAAGDGSACAGWANAASGEASGCSAQVVGKRRGGGVG